jgi:TRAP-type transport system periplasmic protein
MRLRLALAFAAALALSPSKLVFGAELTYGSWPPAADWLNSHALPETFRRIEEATGGEVKWNLIPGGQLAGGVETFNAIQDGIMDAGLGIATYVPNLLPSIATLYGTVVPGNDPVAAAGAAAETVMLHCPSCLEEARKIDQIPFAGYAGAPYVLMCREPIRTVEELKGKRIRASGASLNMMNMAGASVISASLTDAVSLLQRGGLDCVAGVGEWLRTFGYGDFAKYVTDFSFGVSAPAIAFMMNRDKWMALSPEAKQAHLRSFGYLAAEMTITNFIIRNQEAVQEQVAGNGVEIIQAGDDFAKLLADYQKEELGINVEKAKGFGVEDPAAFIAAYKEAVEKWRAISAEVGLDVDKFAERMWEEIYSKVDPEAL